jgi:hypothetical protein
LCRIFLFLLFVHHLFFLFSFCYRYNLLPLKECSLKLFYFQLHCSL